MSFGPPKRPTSVPGTITRTTRTTKMVTPSMTSITSTTTMVDRSGGAGSRLQVPTASGLRRPGGSGLRPPGGSGLRPPTVSGLRPPGESGLRPPGESGLRPPGESGLRPPGGSGLRPPGTSGPRPPGGSCLRPPGESSLRPPGGSGLRPPGGSGLRPPGGSGMRPTSSIGLRPPGGSGMRPPTATGLQPPGVPTARPPGLMPPAARTLLALPSKMTPAVTIVDVEGQRTVATKALDSVPKRSTGDISRTSNTITSKTTTSKTTIVDGREVTKKQTVTKTIPSQASMVPEIPEGRYFIPMRDGPRTKQGKYNQYSSPPEIRHKMEYKLPPELSSTMILPGKAQSQDYRRLMKRQGFKDTFSGNIEVSGRKKKYQEDMDTTSLLNRTIGDDLPEFSDDEGDGACSLQTEVHTELVRSASKSKDRNLKATGVRQSATSPPVIMTQQGPVEGTLEVTASQTVIRSPGQPEVISRSVSGVETVSPGRAVRTDLEIQKLSPKVKTSTQVTGQEVVKVLSSVIIAPGYKQTTRTVTYDAPAPQPEPPLPSPAEVAQLIAEETEDIVKARTLVVPELVASRPVTYGLKKKVELEMLTKESVQLHADAQVPHDPSADEEQEEAQPEMIAGILNTEERGLAMDSAPSNVYNYLFAEQRGAEATVDVCSVAPAPMQDVVVPLEMPNQTQETLNNPEVLQVSINVDRQVGEPIPENIYVESVGKEDPKSTNTARKGPPKKKRKKAPMLSAEVPPWGMTDVDSVIDLIGASPAGTVAPAESQSEEAIAEADVGGDGIEFMLAMENPRHTSRVQLRGSQKPSWFPGYYLALPELPDTIALVKSPSMVFSAAWNATYPDIFDLENVFIV